MHNTGNDIESNDILDFEDNTVNLDILMNADQEYWTDRLGNKRPTIDYALRMPGFTPAGFDFTTGGVLKNGDRNKCVFNQADQTWYSWSGDLPYNVIAGSTPGEGWKVVNRNALTIAREALRRTYLEAGYNLVSGSFETGAVITSTTDVVLHEKTGKCYSGPIGNVPKGTDPLSGNFVDVSARLLSFLTSAHVDYYKYPTTTDTEAIDAAMAASKHVIFGPRKYIYTKELVSVGHTLDGAVSETWSATGTIIEFDIPVTPVSGFAYRNTTKKGFIKNIRFIQKNWNIPLNGMKVDRLIDGVNVEFSYFNGHGGVLTSTDSLSLSCYSASLKNPAFAYNAKHGLVLGGAANAVVIDNPRCNWNGSPSYGVAPSVAGLYDGLYSGGKNSEYPGNPGIFNDPQGVVLIGGDYSYNSRIGLNLDRFFDGVVVGGYGEGNLVRDIKIRTMLGSNVVNFMSQQTPDVAVSGSDPLNPPMNIRDYPNRIVIRGKSYGNGQESATPWVYDQYMDSLKAQGTAGTARVRPTTAGGVQCEQIGGGVINWHFGDLPVMARKAGFGDGFTDGTSLTSQLLVVRRAGDVEGLEAIRLMTGAQSAQMYVVNGSGANAADTAMRIPKHSVTSRSINAGGTVNTSGADYAEYMHKSPNCGDIAKGAICGVDVNGLLTDKFDESISFVIKSTDPSFVGGDTWFTEDEPVVPLNADGEEDSLCPTYLESLSSYRERLEDARRLVDRIAFSGQVPVNVIGAKPGDFIVPVRNEDGTIGGKSITNPTLNEYQISVGKVWRILEDGRALVAVKIT